MEILQFIFRDFWTFIGCLLLIAVIFSLVKAFFDFIVELIHGKQPIINLPKDTKIIQPKEKPFDGVEKVDANIAIEGGDVEVKTFKKK